MTSMELFIYSFLAVILSAICFVLIITIKIVINKFKTGSKILSSKDFNVVLGINACIYFLSGIIICIIDEKKIIIVWGVLLSLLLFFIYYSFHVLKKSALYKSFLICIYIISFYACFLAGYIPSAILKGFSSLAGMGPG